MGGAGRARACRRRCERPVTQIVIVGTGYDGRALRFSQPGVRFFEVDQPVTQQDKRRRIEALGVTSEEITRAAKLLVAEWVAGALTPALALGTLADGAQPKSFCFAATNSSSESAPR